MSTCSDSRRQRGEVLLEALVGVLITGLIGAGMAHMASGVLNSQRDAKVEHLAVAALRNQLQNQGIALCSASSTTINLPTNNATAVAVACTGTTVNVSMGGMTRSVAAPSQVQLTVKPTDLGVKGATSNDTPLTLTSGTSS